jgi:hypothetical protein
VILPRLTPEANFNREGTLPGGSKEAKEREVNPMVSYGIHVNEATNDMHPLLSFALLRALRPTQQGAFAIHDRLRREPGKTSR